MTSDPTAAAEPKLLQERLIAFCDILGFSRRLETSSITDLHTLYSALMDHANTHIFQHDDGVEPGHRNFARAEFLFDSILLVSNPLDSEAAPRSVADFMSALSSLFESSLDRQLPLRGAIGFGDVLEDSQRRISLSAAIPDLVGAEKQQEWAGIGVLESAVGPILDGLYGTEDSQIVQNGTGHVFPYPVPTKTGAPVASHALNWVYFCDRRIIDTGLTFLTGRKRDETERFTQAVNLKLPPDALLPDRVRPAVSLRVRPYRTGFNLKFSDRDGNGVDLPAGTSFELNVVGQRAEQAQMDAGDKTG